ncbi:MAG: MFS transporter [Deltaproteobacteria bacterium]|nr:MFS transporter [Deltaproteobacteria bacterium]
MDGNPELAGNDWHTKINRLSTLIAACGNGAAGVLVFCLMPVLVGSFADHLGLDNSQIGLLSSVYFGCYTLTTLSSILWIRRLNWRYISIFGLLLTICGLVFILQNDSYRGVLIGMGIAGFGAAAAYVLSICMVSDMDDPDRKFAIKLIPEQLVPAILLAILPTWVIAPYGLSGLLIVLAIFFAVITGFALWIPVSDSFERSAEPHSGKEKSTGPVFFALIALLLYFGGFAGLWTFLERIAVEHQLDSAVTGIILALSLIATGVSPVIAAIIGDRLGRNLPMLSGTSIGLVTLFLLAGDLTALRFGIVAIIMPGAVYVVIAYFMGLIAETDTSGRFAVLMSAALSFGATLGPAIFGYIKTTWGDTMSYCFVASMMMAGQLMAFWLNRKLSTTTEQKQTSEVVTL